MVFVPLFTLALNRLSKASARPGGWRRKVRDRLRKLRREVLPTDEESDRRYLEEAQDLHDLEQRMRELDRPGRLGRGPLKSFINR